MNTSRPGATSILQAVELRGEADARPSYFTFVILPLLIVLGTVVVLAAVFITAFSVQTPGELKGLGALGIVGIGLFIAAIVAATVIQAIGLYKVIKRRNEHLARDRLLRQGTLELCRDTSQRVPADGDAQHLEAMERIHNEAQLEENERSAGLHLVLYFLVPLWSFYVFYFLLKDIPRHARRQARFTQHAAKILDRAGAQAPPSTAAIPEHSFLLAFVALVFVPFWALVVLYWIYNDPHGHFDAQWLHEDQLVAVVKAEPPATAGAPTTGSALGVEQPAFTVWTCPDCAKRYKVPPKRPVRVTCKNCGHQEILRA